jgi:hypothetical protein
VATWYAALRAVNLLRPLFIVNGRVFSSVVRHPMSTADYLTLAWLGATTPRAGLNGPDEAWSMRRR